MQKTPKYSLMLILALSVSTLTTGANWHPWAVQASTFSQSSLSITAPPPYSVYLPAVFQPACTSDRLIAFTSTELPQLEISLMCSDGSGRRRVTYTPGFESTDPTWSPDKTRFAFMSTIAGIRGIYIYDLSCDCVTGKIPVDLDAHEPSWSPDGQRMAFDGPNGIYVVNIDGSDLIHVTDDGGDPSWSPDGTRIVYSGASGISILGIDGTGFTQLSTTSGSDWSPAWSPDGTRIAFASDQGFTVNLYVINVDGTGLLQLTDDTRLANYFPSWSPDGKQIAFQAYDTSTRLSEIYIVNADGTGLKLLASQAGEPAWTR